MPLTYSPAYDQLKDDINPFYATMVMAQKAREIESSLGNRITTSEALDFAARGELPNPKNYPDHRLDRVKAYSDYIIDIEVKSAIISSYEEYLIFKESLLILNS